MTDQDRLAPVLTDWLAAHHPDTRDVVVTGLRHPSQGYSNETWLCDVAWTRHRGGREALALVLRLQTTALGTFPDYDLGRQYRCVAALQDSTVPVPRLFGFEQDPAVLGAPFFLMERIDGVVPNENPLYHLEGWLHDLLEDQQADHWMQGIDAIARLARIEPRSLGFEFLVAPEWQDDPLGQQLEYFRRHMRWAESLNRPYPHLQRADAWLHANRPAPVPGRLCWGDAKLGNCVFRDGRLVALLDWEGAHIGSPVMDLAWWITLDRCLCEGYGVPRLSGLPGRAASVARWEAGTGLRATDLEYYEVFSAFKLASIMARIGTLFAQRGLLPAGFPMDTDNGAARVLAVLGGQHGFGAARMSGSIGPLLDADESFNHQIVETFASVLQSDYSWTEKVCGMAAARDGSLAIGFGFGKYVNRNVVDAYGGISRGVEQWTVRASRELASDPNGVDVGPLRYEIIEPLRRIRVVLERNGIQPIAFDIVLEAIVPCMLEEREDRRTLTGYRHSADQIRYHQTGTARGWVEVDGQRHEIRPDTWIMTRDHSWGLRPAVGEPLRDLPPDPMDSELARVLAVWNPLYFERPDGSTYAFHQYYLGYAGTGFRHERMQGGFEFADGRREPLRSIEPVLSFDPMNRRFQRGEFRLTMSDGRPRTLRARAIGDTGFHLGAGLYHGFDGRYHGGYRGRLALEGEYFADCSTPAAVARLNQFRDCLIVVDDSETGATGWGNCQTYVTGAWPEFGLTAPA